MNFITKLFGIPLGYVMWAIHKVIPNYGVALLVFTAITRIFLFPLAIRQQKSSAKMASIQPKLTKLQQKYGHDQGKLNEEMQKLYAEEGYSPTAGCLPLLIQMPILFGLIDVIYRPMTHLLRFSKELIAQATTIFEGLGGAPLKNPSLLELEIVSAVKSGNKSFNALGAGALAAINGLDYTFLGMNLMIKPEWSMLTGIFKGQFNPVILIPILSGITSFLMSYLSTKISAGANAGGADATAGAMKTMMFTMPIFSLWIAFSVPAGVGLYWIYSNIFGIAQSLVMNKFYNTKDLQAQMAEEQVGRKKEALAQAQVERRELQKELLDGKDLDRDLSQKEIDSLRLAAARKKMADKYGDGDKTDDETTKN